VETLAGNGFADILGLIADESERVQFEQIVSKYPQVKEGFLRQEDYSRKLAETEEQRKYAEAWDIWKQNNWLADHNMTKQQYEALLENEALRQQLQKAGEPMDFAQLDKYLGEKGYVAKKDVEELLATKEPEVEQLVDGRYAALSAVMSKTMPLVVKHLKEFDEALDVDAMYANAVKLGINDPDAAYNAYVSDRRAERMKQDHEKAVNEAFERGKQTVQQQIAMGAEGRMPVDLNGPEMGHLQNSLSQTPTDAEKAANVVPENVELGKGVSRFVAAHFRQKEAGAS
jgi:hypothetical protein